MILPNDGKWAEWGISEEHHKFFVARWHELFHENTFDTWQVRSTNIHSILEEILLASKVVEDVHVYHHNISALIEEAENVVKVDSTIKVYFPFVNSYIERIKQAYDEKVKNENNRDLDSFNRLINVLLGNLNGYKGRVIDSLREVISKRPEKYKISLYYLTMSLAVELRLAGYSITALRSSQDILVDHREPIFIKRLDNLINSFSRDRESYSCKFLVSWPKIAPDLSRYDIQLSVTRPTSIETNEEIEFYAQDEQALLATVNITALDPFDARNRAQELLERFFSVNKLYTLSRESRIRQKKALVTDSHNYQTLIPEDRSRLAYIKDSKNPHKDVERFAQIQEELSVSDKGQLFASLQHHKLFLVASTDEARLVNLWVAIETLVQDGGRNILERISRYVPFSDATGYIARVARAFPTSILRLWRTTNTKEFRKKLKFSDEDFLNIKDVVSILTDVENGDLITSFITLVKDHPLLTFRTQRLWDKTFGSPTVMAHKIESHKKHTDWQIRRIYRARNSIVHQGCCPLGARQLIQHLHSYYIYVIHNLIHDLEMNPAWSIADSLEHRRLLYETLILKLREYHKEPFSAECILEPQCLLGRFEPPPAWNIEKLKEKHEP